MDCYKDFIRDITSSKQPFGPKTTQSSQAVEKVSSDDADNGLLT